MRFMIEWIIEFRAKKLLRRRRVFLLLCAQGRENGRRNDIYLTFLFKENHSKEKFFVLLKFHIRNSDKDVKKGLLFIRPCRHRM